MNNSAPKIVRSVLVSLAPVCLAFFMLWGAISWAAAEPAEPALAPDLAYTQIVTIGQNGFTQASYPKGIKERMVFAGEQNGAGRTLYLYDDGGFIQLLPPDGTLPNGMGTATSFTALYAMVPNGDVLFNAVVSGGSLPAGTYTFRWSNGSITLQQPTIANYSFMAADGRWLVSEITGASPTQTVHYSLSDGTNVTPIVSLTDENTSCDFTTKSVHGVNSNNVVVYLHQKTEKSVCSPGFRHLREWSVRFGGTISATLLSGSYTWPAGGKPNGIEARMLHSSLINDANKAIFYLYYYNGTSSQPYRVQLVMVTEGGVEQVLYDTDNTEAYGVGGIRYFDAQDRIVGLRTVNGNLLAIVRGLGLGSDLVIQQGEELFGSTVTVLQQTFSAYEDISTPGENRGYYFEYILADGTTGIALASKNIPHWADPNGGDWGDGDNWTPSGVPTDTAEVAFDLAGSYAVNLGTRQIGGVFIENGDVTFRNGALQVTPLNLAINGFNPENQPHLTIGETGVPISNTTLVANISIGAGELTIRNSQVAAPNQASLPGTVELGVTGPATVTVSDGAIWEWQQMYVGFLDTTHLRIEKGAFAGATPAEKMVIGAGSLPTANTASVVVDGAGNDPGPFSLGTTLGASILDLIIGQGLVGSLEVRNGGSVSAITTTLGTMDHGAMTDATLVVSGRNATRPSTFFGGNDVVNNGGLLAAVAQGSDVQIEVVDGGLMLVTFLSLADGPQSSALMFVDGENGGERSRLQAPLPATVIPQNPNPAAGLCVVGRKGSGVLNLSNGGLAECHNIFVGFEPGSQGEINLGAGSMAIARATLNGDGLICIGSVAGCGSSGTQGTVNILSGGVLEGENVLIGTNGQVRGSGTVFALQGVGLLGGKIAPGIQQLIPGLRSTGAALTIEGDLTVDASGEIALDLFGAKAGMQDTLVITGTLAMNGRLVLNFGNGYAPKANDEWTLIQAGGSTWTPAEIVIDGLKPGFEYAMEFSGGALTVTALTDGVLAPEQSLIFLPLVSRP